MSKMISRIVSLVNNPVILTIIIVFVIAGVLFIIFKKKWNKVVIPLIKKTWEGSLKVDLSNVIFNKIKDEKIDERMINVVANAIDCIPFLNKIPYSNKFIKSILFKISQKTFDKLKAKLNK